MQFSQQLVSQCRCETSCWRIAQCNMCCLAIFLLRRALHKVELSPTFSQRIAPTGNTIAQCITPPATCLAILRQLPQIYGACAQFLFFVPRSIARQVAEKIAQCNRALIIVCEKKKMKIVRMKIWLVVSNQIASWMGQFASVIYIYIYF